MAFNIHSGAGWFRLWVFTSVLLGGVALFYIFAKYPNSLGIQAHYDMEMNYLTSEGVARKREWYESERTLGLFGPHQPSLPSPEQLEQARAETKVQYADAMAELPGKQLRHVLFAVVSWAVTSLTLLGFGWLIGWVIRGFTSPKTVV